MHGAQILSWKPIGHREVFWLSPLSSPAPAAIRGGVPVCWPWFGKQGMPQGAMQHGPVRIRTWDVVSVQNGNGDGVSLTLSPSPATSPDDPMARFADHLHLSLQIDLADTLTQTLETRNGGNQSFALTQALHSYFAVHDAAQVRVAELAGLHYHDKLLAPANQTPQIQQGPFALHEACDRIYQQATATPMHRYTLEDPTWQRRIHLETQGSQSLVVWNPGEVQTRKMAEVPDRDWPHFLCLEAANAGSDVVTLAPGAQYRLIQTLAAEHWQA